MNEELKPCPFCGGSNIESRVCDYGTKLGGKPYIVGCRDCDISTSMLPQVAKLKGYKSAKEAAEAAWNKRAANTFFLPARVGDSIVVKDGDSTDTLRIDGFELRGDELMVWGEGENERYVAFAQHEIIKYIPKEEEVKNWDNQ